MIVLSIILAVVVIFGLRFYVLPVLAGTYAKWRGRRLVSCPEDGKMAAVEVDAAFASRTALLGHRKLRVKECSRCLAPHACGQECLQQIEAAPDDCHISRMLTTWYKGKACASCGQPIGKITAPEHTLALLSPEGEVVTWQDIRLEVLPDVLDTHQPLCWRCHIARSSSHEQFEPVIEPASRWQRFLRA